ncbi:MAG: gliding motility protein RemB, partial [Pedobacter sp.]
MKKLGLLFLIALAFTTLRAQNTTPNQIIPYDFQFYQKLNKSVYSQDNRVHSSIRGFYADDSNLSLRY